MEKNVEKELKTTGEGREKIEYPESPVDLSQENFREVLNKYPVVLVDFWAEWCGACTALEPIIENLADKFSDEVFFGKVNIDNSPELAREFNVSGIPTLFIAKDGELVDKTVGLEPEKSLEEKLRKYLS